MPDSLHAWTPASRSRRGAHGAGRLSGAGVVVLLLLIAGAGGVADALLNDSLGHLFDAAFVVACVLAALAVRHGTLATAIVAPPIVYAVLVIVLDVFVVRPSGGWVSGQFIAAGDALVTGAPAIWLGTALSAAIIGLRKLRGGD
jgi:hypothetical protein